MFTYFVHYFTNIYWASTMCCAMCSWACRFSHEQNKPIYSHLELHSIVCAWVCVCVCVDPNFAHSLLGPCSQWPWGLAGWGQPPKRGSKSANLNVLGQLGGGRDSWMVSKEEQVVKKLNMENAQEENKGGDQTSLQSREESCHLGERSGQKPEAIQAGTGQGDLSLVLTGHIQQA